MAAPRRSLPDPDLGVGTAVGLGDGGGEVDDVEAAVRGWIIGGDEPLEEQVAERLVVAVELAVGRDDHERVHVRPSWVAPRTAPTTRPGAARCARARSGPRRPWPPARRTRARQVAVVEHDRDVAAVPDLHAVRPPGVEVLDAACHGARIVAAIPASASAASVARSTAVSGSHIAVGRRPKRTSKSRAPQRISVRRSRVDASGRIVWWYGWAIPVPPPRGRPPRTPRVRRAPRSRASRRASGPCSR